MQRFKTPKKSLFDHLTHDNYFLNERYKEAIGLYNESIKMVEILRKDVDYMNKFIYSTYDLSSNNYSPNLKIVAYDSSDNVITYICTDSSGNFSSTIPLGEHLQTLSGASQPPDQSSPVEKPPSNLVVEKLRFSDQNIPSQDVSNNAQISDKSRCYPFYDYPYHHHHSPYYHHHHHHHRHRHRYLDGDMDEDRDITSKPTNVVHTTTVNGVVTNTDEEPRHLYPYGGYPYGLLDEYDYRNVELNHPYHPPPQYPIVKPPVHPPAIHRDLTDHTSMHKQYETEGYAKPPFVPEAVQNDNSVPNHMYTTK